VLLQCRYRQGHIHVDCIRLPKDWCIMFFLYFVVIVSNQIIECCGHHKSMRCWSFLIMLLMMISLLIFYTPAAQSLPNLWRFSWWNLGIAILSSVRQLVLNLSRVKAVIRAHVVVTNEKIHRHERIRLDPQEKDRCVAVSGRFGVAIDRVVQRGVATIANARLTF